jgi:hypothetical protein
VAKPDFSFDYAPRGVGTQWKEKHGRQMGYVGRTLLSAAFDFLFGKQSFAGDATAKPVQGKGKVESKVNVKSQVKGGGQECPPHIDATSFAWR